jgi:hypothetical protein
MMIKGKEKVGFRVFRVSSSEYKIKGFFYSRA